MGNKAFTWRSALSRCSIVCSQLSHEPDEYHQANQPCPVEAKIQALLGSDSIVAQPDELQAGLVEDDDDGHHEVRGLDQIFRTKAELKAKGFAFAFRYGSEALQRALAWLP